MGSISRAVSLWDREHIFWSAILTEIFVHCGWGGCDRDDDVDADVDVDVGERLMPLYATLRLSPFSNLLSSLGNHHHHRHHHHHHHIIITRPRPALGWLALGGSSRGKTLVGGSLSN